MHETLLGNENCQNDDIECEDDKKKNSTNYLGFRASMYFLKPGLSGRPKIHWATKQTMYGTPTNTKPVITGKHQHLLGENTHGFIFRLVI